MKGVIHRVKGEGDRNAIAVADRSMMTIKKDLAGEVAIKGGTWADHLAHVTKAFDERYQPAVHGPPAKLADFPNSPQNFFTLQDNAARFAHNESLTKKRKGDLERLGGFRDPISNGQRSFKASYGSVHEVDSVLPGALKVRDTEGNESLLKLVKAVPKGSGEAVASMARKAEPVKRKAPSAGSGKPMGKIPTAAGTPLEEGRKKGASSSSASIPQSSGSASSKPPASKEDRFEGLRLMQGYLGPKRTPEELAAAKAKAAENKRQKEAEDARKAGEKARKAREKAELEAKEKAEKERRKAQLKQLRAERVADDKARLKARG